jgi:hypothetical protein
MPPGLGQGPSKVDVCSSADGSDAVKGALKTLAMP